MMRKVTRGMFIFEVWRLGVGNPFAHFGQIFLGREWVYI